jgi:hypothetical protein
MLHRYPKIPESGDLADGDYSTDDGYQDWWGYVRYEPGENGPRVDAPDYDEPLTVEQDERVPLHPNRGWPGKPLNLEVIHSHERGGGFEALVREHVEPAGA